MILNVIVMTIISLNVITLNAIMRIVIRLNVIVINFIVINLRLNVIMQTVITPSVLAPKNILICCSQTTVFISRPMGRIMSWPGARTRRGCIRRARSPACTSRTTSSSSPWTAWRSSHAAASCSKSGHWGTGWRDVVSTGIGCCVLMVLSCDCFK